MRDCLHFLQHWVRETGTFAAASTEFRMSVDALDKENQFLNFLQIQGNVVSPDLSRSSIELPPHPSRNQAIDPAQLGARSSLKL